MAGLFSNTINEVPNFLESSEQNAAAAQAAANAAQGSANEADLSAQDAASSAVDASNSATAADQSAQEVFSQVSNAEDAQAAAQLSASEAATSSLEAEGFASDAEASATSIGNTEGVVLGYRDEAETFKNQAGASATAAFTSESNAATSESNAQSSANASESSATDSSTSALESEHWAVTPENTPVPEGNGSQYSAFHYAQKSIQGATDAQNSADSITGDVAEAEAARDAAQGFANDSAASAVESANSADEAFASAQAAESSELFVESASQQAGTHAANAEVSSQTAQEWATGEGEIESGLYSSKTYAEQAQTAVTDTQTIIDTLGLTEAEIDAIADQLVPTVDAANAAQTAATEAQASATSASDSESAASSFSTQAYEWAVYTFGPVENIGGVDYYSAKYYADQAEAWVATLGLTEAEIQAVADAVVPTVDASNAAITAASEAETSASEAATSANTADNRADLALTRANEALDFSLDSARWASYMQGPVESDVSGNPLYSSKYYALEAKDWAVKMDGEVEGGEFSAKYWADQAAGAVSGVASFNTRSGAVVPQAGDYTAAMVGAYSTSEVYTKSQTDGAIQTALDNFDGGGGGTDPGTGGGVETYVVAYDPAVTTTTIPWETETGLVFYNAVMTGGMQDEFTTRNGDGTMTIDWSVLSGVVYPAPSTGDIFTFVNLESGGGGGVGGGGEFEYTVQATTDETFNVPFYVRCGALFYNEWEVPFIPQIITFNADTMTIPVDAVAGYVGLTPTAGDIITVIPLIAPINAAG